MAKEKLNGIYIPMVTPFHEDESINFAGIKEAAFVLPAGPLAQHIAAFRDCHIFGVSVHCGDHAVCVYHHSVPGVEIQRGAPVPGHNQACGV